jgi:hypothetical protein
MQTFSWIFILFPLLSKIIGLKRLYISSNRQNVTHAFITGILKPLLVLPLRSNLFQFVYVSPSLVISQGGTPQAPGILEW